MSNLKRFLAMSLAMLMIISGAALVSAKTFPDVKTSDSYATAVDVLSDIGVIVGGDDGNFQANANVTREQMALFIARYQSGKPSLFVSNATVAKPFKDLTDPTYYLAISYAVEKGIIHGRSATQYDGKANVTYSEAVKMVVTALGYTVEKIDGPTWFVPYMTVASEIGMLKGFEGKGALQNMTRGEVAQLLYNAFNKPMNEFNQSKIVIIDGIATIVPQPKTIAADRFFASTVTGIVEATANYAIGTAGITTPSKNNANPIRIAGQTKQLDLVNDFGFAANFRAEDLLGKEVSYTTLNGKILGELNIIGESKAVTKAAYDADKKTLTIGEETLNFNYAEDQIVYTLNNGKLVKVENDALKQVNNGFYLMTAINNRDAADMFIYYPLSVAQVGDDLTAKKTVINGLTIENAIQFENAKEAKKGDYVLYFANSKTVIISDVAIKSDVVTVSKEFTGSQKATMSNGKTYEKKANTVANSMGLDFVLNGKYNVYTVNGEVVYVAGEGAGTYRPAKTYSVFEMTGKQRTTSYNETFFPVRLRDALGNAVLFEITKLNDATVGTTPAWNTSGSNAMGIDGRIVVKDGTTLVTSDSDKFFTVKQNGDTAGEAEVALAANTSIQRITNNLYSVNTASGTQNFIMADYSVVLAKLTINGKTEYYSYKGVDAMKSALTATASNGSAIFYGKANEAIQSLTFMYIEATVASAPATTDTKTGDAYIVISEVSISANEKAYKAQNLATGELSEIVSKKDADGNIATFVKGDIVRVTSDTINSTMALTSAAASIGYSNGFVVIGDKYLTAKDTTVAYTYDKDADKFVASNDVAGKVTTGRGAVIASASDPTVAAFIVIQAAPAVLD